MGIVITAMSCYFPNWLRPMRDQALILGIALVLAAASAFATPAEYPIHFQFRVSSDVSKHGGSDSQDMVIDTRALFAGDSVSSAWLRAEQQRAVAVPGSTTAMIVARFVQELQKGSPAYGHILAGTNDFYLAPAGGPDTGAMLRSVDEALDAARKAHVPVIIGTVTPMDPSRSPNAGLIPAYNALLVQHVGHRAVIADYYSAMVLPSGAQNSALFYDGIHPNAAGYAAMNIVLDRAIAEVNRRQERHQEGHAERGCHKHKRAAK